MCKAGKGASRRAHHRTAKHGLKVVGTQSLCPPYKPLRRHSGAMREHRTRNDDAKFNMKAFQFARNWAGSGCATIASPSWFSCSRGIEKQTEKPSEVRSVTMVWRGSVACSIDQDASG